MSFDSTGSIGMHACTLALIRFDLVPLIHSAASQDSTTLYEAHRLNSTVNIMPSSHLLRDLSHHFSIHSLYSFIAVFIQALLFTLTLLKHKKLLVLFTK